MARPGFVLAAGDLATIRESVSVMNVLNGFDHNDKSSAVLADEMGDRGHTATIDMG